MKVVVINSVIPYVDSLMGSMIVTELSGSRAYYCMLYSHGVGQWATRLRWTLLCRRVGCQLSSPASAPTRRSRARAAQKMPPRRWLASSTSRLPHEPSASPKCPPSTPSTRRRRRTWPAAGCIFLGLELGAGDQDGVAEASPRLSSRALELFTPLSAVQSTSTHLHRPLAHL